MSEVEHSTRLTRVEGEVESIRTDIGGIKNQVTGLDARMRGFGDILNRIETGVASAQQRFDDDKQASRINPIALTTVLVTVMSILVGGAWLVSGGLSTTSTRLDDQERSMSQLVAMRDRELDLTNRRIDRLEMSAQRAPADQRP